MTTTTTLEQELTQLEKRYWKAMGAKDLDTLEQLTDFPCIVAGSHGVSSIDRATFMKMAQDPSRTITDATLNDIHVRQVTDDVAVVAYTVHEALEKGGRAMTLDAADCSTWVRRNGSWACVAHSEAILS
jgi:Domain of unknown function (DUF4440)